MVPDTAHPRPVDQPAVVPLIDHSAGVWPPEETDLLAVFPRDFCSTEAGRAAWATQMAVARALISQLRETLRSPA